MTMTGRSGDRGSSNSGSSSSGSSSGGGNCGSGSGGCHVSVFLVVTIVVVAMVVNGEATGPTTTTTTTTTQHHHHHHNHNHHHRSSSIRKYGHLPIFGITNGTDQVIKDGQDGFIHCFANVRFPLRVVWTDQYGRLIPWITDRRPSKRDTDSGTDEMGRETDRTIKQAQKFAVTDEYGRRMRLNTRKRAIKRNTDRTDGETRKTDTLTDILAVESVYGRHMPWITNKRVSKRTTDGRTDGKDRERKQADVLDIESANERPLPWTTNKRPFKRDTDAETGRETRTTDREAENTAKSSRNNNSRGWQDWVTNPRTSKKRKGARKERRDGATDRTDTQTDTEPQIFAVEGSHPLPNSFLIFKNFRPEISGSYMCSLFYRHTRLDYRTINLHYFTPSYRIVPLPRCLRVPKGGSVIVPSPVQGRPARSPEWTVLEGESTNVVVGKMSGGELYLRGLKGPIAWRSKVSVGGGLTYVQDVYVSVEKGRLEVTATPTGSKLCPTSTLRGNAAATDTDTPTDSPYAPSVALANELIENIQLNALRRRLEGEE